MNNELLDELNDVLFPIGYIFSEHFHNSGYITLIKLDDATVNYFLIKKTDFNSDYLSKKFNNSLPEENTEEDNDVYISPEYVKILECISLVIPIRRKDKVVKILQSC